MDFGKDLDIFIEANIGRWNEFRKNLSHHSVDRFVKRGLGRIDDMVDEADCGGDGNTLADMRTARRNLNLFLDEWEARKERRVVPVSTGGKTSGTSSFAPDPASDDEFDGDEEDNDDED